MEDKTGHQGEEGAMRSTSWWMFGLAVVVALAFGIRAAAAADMGYADELKTAIFHSGLAQKYDTMKEVGLHLHHVVNCIVGPDDPMFDKTAGNPCQGQGKGLLVDMKAKMGQDKAYYVAWWVAHMADDAIKMGNLDQAKAAGAVAETQLTALSKM